jgi:UDP-N-acetylmuramoyl-L-alanyl-D-glutamate--2,6-diaminopimelate ligase
MRLRLRVGGRFNFANALVAIAMADQVSEITQAQVDELAKVEVPGRMQVIAKNGATVIVDYAHSPAAISSVISSLRDLVSGKLIVVLGAGGDRDSSKREFMGSALNGADLIFVTDDNPRTEDPALIRKAIIAGINSIGVALVEVPDRALAITKAVNSIESPEDLVLILGKGHEQGQQVGNVIMDFDDVATAENAVENRVVNE